MKRINLEHLSLRLPADRNFVEFVNSSANSNIIALCKVLFPQDKAVVLYGLDVTTTNICTAGAIYYNEEIFFIDAFLLPQGPKIGGLPLIDFCIREVVSNVVYMSGDELPGYIERKIFPILQGENDPVIEALKFENMIRLNSLNYTKVLNDTDFTGSLRLSTLAKHAWLDVDVELRGSSDNYVFIPIQGGKIPDQSLGFVPLLYTSLFSVVAEKKYRLFVLDQHLCVASETHAGFFDSIFKCATFREIFEHFASIGRDNNPAHKIILNHKTLLQL